MENVQSLNIAAAPYAAVADMLGACEEWDTGGGLYPLRVQFSSCACFAVHDQAGRMVGAFALDLVEAPGGPEGVIVGAAGHVAGLDLIGLLHDHIIARFEDCAAVRAHTRRPGLARRLASLGWRTDGLILRKTL